jgi:enoyl-CoA hydratase/carnithine racemase
MSEFIVKSVEAGVLTVRMNRPDKKNALTAAMYQALADALDEAASSGAIRATLILGVPGAFTAGNDIGDFLKTAMSGNRDSNAVFEFLERIIMAKKPVVAGVDGLAIGVGVTLLMHCDYVVASLGSTFRTPFVDLGLLPEAGSSLIAPRIMGHHRAFALLAMGEAFSASDAHAAGLVNKVVPPTELEASATAAARAIAAKPAEALSISRDLVRGDRSDILARMREEAVLWEARLKSDEAKHAFMAFMQRAK